MDAAANPQPAGTVVPPKVHAAATSRSRRLNNPLAAINRNSEFGRATIELTARWLEQIGTDPDHVDKLVLRDVIAAAELSLRCDQARLDPKCSPASLAWIENSLHRRLRALGLSTRRSGHTKLVRAR